jgi:sarcosine oxidase subunit alpha
MMRDEANRLAPPFGALIDRSKRIEFEFEGRAVAGLAGDTIASALAANGQWMISRSFKYHRPRGVLTMAGYDANALVQVGEEPNCLADVRLIEPGLKVEAQNYFGSFESDRGRFVELARRFLPVGFYYKTFHEKRRSWKLWEPMVRRLAGLGRADLNADFHHAYYDKQYLFADVAVVGGGPAGMAAALAAAEAGAETILIDEGAALGGSMGYSRFDAGGTPADRLRELVTAIDGLARIRVLDQAQCTGLFADSWLPVVRANRLYKLRAKACIIATGSIPQPSVFRNNDLPGIMFGAAAQRLMRLYGVRPGSRAVILAANDDGYGQALDLLEAGVAVQAIVDLRAAPPATPMSEAVRGQGVAILKGHAVAEARRDGGGSRVAGALVAPIVAEGELGAPSADFDCDLLLMSVGYSPAGHLLHHAGAKFDYCRKSHMFRPETLPAGVFAAGSVNNRFSLDSVLADGRLAGHRAARHSGFGKGGEPTAPGPDGSESQTHPWPIFPHRKGMDFVDFDEDLKYEDLVNGIADGFDNVELLKRYSTVGMGPSQGKHSAVAAVRIVARETGADLSGMSVTTQRPPFAPEKFGHLAGRVFEPERRTAMHHRHLGLGAQMMPAGLWWRPAYYGAPSARAAAITEEVSAVRNGGVDRRFDPGWARRARAGRGRVPEPHVHLRLCQAADRSLPLRADDRQCGRHYRRRRRRPVPRGAFLRHRHHQWRRCRLSPDAAMERAMAPRRRCGQRNGRLCRGERRRAEIARGIALDLP